MKFMSPLQRQKVFHFIYSNKLKWAYMVVGIALVLFSIAGHAFSFDVSAPENTFVLQQGSSISFDAGISIDSADHSYEISFTAHDNPFVKFDGQLTPTISQDSFNRKLKIVVSPLAPVGEYHLMIEISADDGFYRTVEELEFPVTVVKRSGSYYTTTPQTNIPPAVSNVIFSNTSFILDRDQTGFLQVSFKNTGSLTDFHVYFVKEPSEFSAAVESPYLLRIGQNETAQTFIQFDTNASTKTGDYLLTLKSQDVASGKTFNLGAVAVKIVSEFNAKLILQKTVYSLTEGESIDTFATVDNKSSSDQEFYLVASSDMIEFSSDTIVVPAKTSQKVPFKITAGSVGNYVVRIGMNGEDNSILSTFEVKVSQSSEESAAPSDGISGLIGGGNSLFLGLILIIILAGAYFIFQEKPKTPEAKTEASPASV